MGAPAASRHEALAQIIDSQPASEMAARARYELGGMHLRDGDLERATHYFRDVSPNWPRWHSQAGLAIARIYDDHVHDVEAAAREYRKLIRRHPETFAAAEGHARMAEIYEAVGDGVSAENMRECAMRAFQRLLAEADDADERDRALERFVDACRRLERWDAATDALVKARRQAVRRRDATRRAEFDRQLGTLYLDREQYGNALIRLRACLQHVRRRGEDVEAIVRLSEQVARCQEASEDRAGARRTYRALLDFLRRGKDRRQAVQRDAELVRIMTRAYLATDQTGQARQLRARLKRMRGVRDSLAAVEAELQAVGAA